MIGVIFTVMVVGRSVQGAVEEVHLGSAPGPPYSLQDLSEFGLKTGEIRSDWISDAHY